MAEPLIAQRWGHRIAYVGIAGMLFFMRLLPLDPGPGGWPGPDVLLALTMAWVLRRPDCLPALLIVAVFLLEDMLCQRPPGLWAALVLMGTEFLRGRIALMRGLPFLAEWAMVTGVIVTLVVANRLVLTLALVPQVGWGPEMARALFTALAYPVVAVLARLTFERVEREREARRA